MSSSLMGDVAMRWVVTLLFGASIAIYVYILVAQRGRWTSIVNHLLHLVMSAGMILMALGRGNELANSRADDLLSAGGRLVWTCGWPNVDSCW
ncbi:MAG TPA: hypothetical protein VME67_01130, partial [Mycobacterium sp.]|nr:hypothetical protein [Mycobacterium sp.]